MKTSIVVVVKLLFVGWLLAWALPSRGAAYAVNWQATNRITKGDNGLFTTAANAANAYALALADLSSIDGIGTVGTVNIQFYCRIPAGSRWMLGIGDKQVRGTTANGSSNASYNTDGLFLRFGEAKANNTFNVNGAETVNAPAVGEWLVVSFAYNRVSHTYSYSLSNVYNSTVYYSASGVSTSVSTPSVIEAYSWMNNTTIEISNVIVSFNDFYFPHGAEIAYIEDMSYTLPLVNNTGQTASYAFSSTNYFRQNGATLIPKATTGSQPANDWEGDAISVTATASGQQPTTFYLRIKTRNLINPASLCTSNAFDAGTTLGLLTSNTVALNGLTLSFSKSTDKAVVRSIGGDYGITIIDENGYSFGNIANGTTYGTVYKIVTSAAKRLHVTGYFTSNDRNAVLMLGNTQVGTIVNPGDGSLASASFDLAAGQTYYLYAQQYAAFALKTLSYTNATFAQSSVVTAIPADGHYRQTVSDMSNPVYSIAEVAGDLKARSVTINSQTGQLSGLTAGGAVRVQATGGGHTAAYVLTVAYPATDYPGRIWNFYEELGGLNTSSGLKTVPSPTATTTDSHGNQWTARYKSGNRAPRWYYDQPVAGNNAFIVEETAGLVFNTESQGFYIRNDESEYTHVGIHNSGATLTIPQLEAGDIVELMWRHEVTGSGSEFTATNVTDLRGKSVSEPFLITGTSQRSKTRFVGAYSFIATGGDVTFTLTDNGNCDIQSVRIYKGAYHPTMRSINQQGNIPAPNSMIVDDAVNEGYVYNYCNQLYSTATGPAMYVLKGYRPQTGSGGTVGVDYDHPGCVTGVDAALTPTQYTDEDAYPVSDEERQQLFELRKNIIGLEVYNEPWQSNNNSYNYGRIKASGGWGKVTIRMNNYTNDMKYLIGYTPDYTINIGSAPHQQYPYTWDFTNISSQAAEGQPRNVYNIVSNEDYHAVNWTNTVGGVFELNTNNDGPMESQYVPGAVLVTTEKALSKYNGDIWQKYALDELDGLGVSGKISIDTDTDAGARTYRSATARSPLAARRRAASASRIDLLQFTMDEYKIVNTAETDENGETFVTDWRNDTGFFNTAGNGFVRFGADKIEETNVAVCGFSYKCDRSADLGSGISLQPARRLKNGDIISIKAYATSAPSDDKPYALGLYADNTTTALATMYLPNNIKNFETELSYTVTDGDGLEGLDVINIYRIGNSVFLTEVDITGDPNAEPVIREMFCETPTTLTIPDVSPGQRIYVSTSMQPSAVSGAEPVASTSSDAAEGVWRYDVTDSGNAFLTFPIGARIYKIGVTDIVKTLHPVGTTGWATESRDHAIDHTLTGYFTTAHTNAYTVAYDSYDLHTATVALTPVSESGYVPAETGIIMRQDNNVPDADTYEVPLFYPSYTREAADIAADNMLVPVVTGGRQWLEVSADGKQKFILTNVHWLYSTDSGWGQPVTDTDAAGFYRLHIWGDATRDQLPDHCAYLGVPQAQLPVAAWNAAAGSRLVGTIGIRDINDKTTAITRPSSDSPHQSSVPITLHTLNGTRLSAPPTKAGVYISHGRKVIVK